MLQGERLAWPAWAMVLAFVNELQHLRDDEGKSEVLCRVAAVKAAARFDAESAALDLQSPVLAGDDPWFAVVDWAEGQLAAIADATSPVFIA